MTFIWFHQYLYAMLAFATLGVLIPFIITLNPQAISMAISIAVKSLNTMHHDSMSVNFVRFVHTFPLPHNAT